MNLPGMGAATPSLLGYGCMRFPLRPDGTVDEAQALYCKEKEEFDALAKKLNTPVEPADDEQAVAIAAASEANKTAWVKAGTYKISVNGKEFLVELEKEVVRFR